MTAPETALALSRTCPRCDGNGRMFCGTTIEGLCPTCRGLGLVEAPPRAWSRETTALADRITTLEAELASKNRKIARLRAEIEEVCEDAKQKRDACYLAGIAKDETVRALTPNGVDRATVIEECSEAVNTALRRQGWHGARAAAGEALRALLFVGTEGKS